VADSQTCVTCGKQAPETETNYTLISAQFGWRLTRYKRADGTLVLEWRCPNCWKEFKRSRNGGTAMGPGGITLRPSSTPPPSDAPLPPARPGRPSR
jgi:DNA-directed RNA polymerase subunit RPC12/RpoP